jgi:hypothetical protein
MERGYILHQIFCSTDFISNLLNYNQILIIFEFELFRFFFYYHITPKESNFFTFLYMVNISHFLASNNNFIL